jgi:hypothetical protein
MLQQLKTLLQANMQPDMQEHTNAGQHSNQQAQPVAAWSKELRYAYCALST